MKDTKTIIGSALASIIGIMLLFFIFGVINGAMNENRAIQIEQKLEELKEQYRELAPLAAEQRVSCVRVKEIEEQMATIHRQANSLRSELSTYNEKKALAAE